LKNQRVCISVLGAAIPPQLKYEDSCHPEVPGEKDAYVTGEGGGKLSGEAQASLFSPYRPFFLNKVVVQGLIQKEYAWKHG
jgi:hypothetical protein